MSKQQLTILLIEDNPGDARLIQELLSQQDQYQFQVTIFEQLATGLAYLASNKPDAVLLDLSLPDSQGLATLRIVLESAPQTPVVVLTGLNDDATGLETLQQGAEDYLVKGEIDDILLPRAIRYAIERKHAHDEITKSQQFLQSALDTLSAHLAVLDEAGTIVAVNDSWRRFADQNGLNDPTYGVGQNYLAICEQAAQAGDDDARIVAEGIGNILRGQGNGFYHEYPCHSPDEQRWFMVRLNHFSLGNSHHVIASHHSITERVLIEHAEHEQRVLAEALSETAHTVNSTLELEQVLARILTAVGSVFPHSGANVMLTNADGTAVRVVHICPCYAKNGLPEPQLGNLIPIDNKPLLRQMRDSRQALAVSNVRNNPNWNRREPAEWSHSYMGAPIMSGDKTLGFLNLESETPGFFTVVQARQLQSFADQVAVAIQNAQLFDIANRRADYLAALNQASRQLGREVLNQERLLPSIVTNLTAAAGSAVTCIWMLDETDNELVLHAFAGNYTRLEGNYSRIRIDDRSPVSYIARNRQWVVTNHIREDGRFDQAWVKTHGFVAFAGYPLLRNEQLVGVLALFSYTRIDDILLDVISSFVNQAATAIENAHLYQELENYSEYLQQAVKERTEELYNSVERIETILNSVNEALLVVKPDGRIEQVNPAFEQQTGYTFLEVEMQQLRTLFADTNSQAIISESMTALKAAQPWRGEMGITRKDGTTYEALLTHAPVMNEQLVPIVFVVSFVDISDQKRIEQTLRQALEREIEVSEMRTRFLSMATHDLRNPLAVIRSSIDMLAEYHERMSSEKKEAKFTQIRSSISFMVELLDDILIIGRAETGNLAFNPEPVDLETFCHSILAEIQASIGINHHFDFSLTGQRIIRQMDPKLLRHILYNLLSNAVKYSPPHSTITFELKPDRTQTVFRVQDEGIGIPEADLPRLFEAFHRARNVGPVSGTGLGLAIVKRSAELHGGTVICDTQQGKGTTFIVTLPNRVPEETP